MPGLCGVVGDVLGRRCVIQGFWGDGDYGKLGHGNTVTVKVPRLVGGPLNGREVVSVSAGYRHSACVTRDGELFTWGEGDYGRLGHGDCSSRYTPTPVRGLGAVGSVVCGSTHTLALSADGRTVWSFGSGDHGKLGHGDSNKVYRPQAIDGLLGLTIIKLATGTHVSLALSSTNEVWVWGNGPCLGLGVVETLVPRPLEQLNKYRIVDIAAGDSHVLALSHDSQVFAWGANAQGQCGQGHTITPLPLPRRVVGITRPVHHITAGTTHSIAWTAHPDSRWLDRHCNIKAEWAMRYGCPAAV
ncbi:Regulator of chromosome condensation RCC1 [Trinorchestia longiramus]|nr:Regulator of chromosome condensation RCC1 [Trinorchestia longiramus]